MTQAYHQTKFRWTENLTCRFIQLRKENGKLFTGRKYSAQAGWEFILRQMREEFPTIMADVHYRVLKKKWSNLLQQYKELKNPVHGDRNKVDDVSWPFYTAIDEVLGFAQRTSILVDDVDDGPIDPHEFLCVSVTPDETASPDEDIDIDKDYKDWKDTKDSIDALQRIQALQEDCYIEIEKIPRAPNNSVKNSRIASLVESRSLRVNKDNPVSRLPRATELSLKTVRPSATISVKDLSKLKRSQESAYQEENGCGAGSMDQCTRERGRKVRKVAADRDESHECATERRLAELLEYTKRRDEENRTIMTRILHAVEKIANKM
ncbi:uncharacterized protein LOC107269246 [Cephus cinctus]|uniref:Uncharacterized protein LOC107269246 n=1 Tax=Cephus cinctus TaxID=211228 RepID=A0AAJ7C0B8_CEPCN|nr:uncharacterized protein LOC107269246 [Cephus cinctus]